jgi:hypothetical protein
MKRFWITGLGSVGLFTMLTLSVPPPRTPQCILVVLLVGSMVLVGRGSGGAAGSARSRVRVRSTAELGHRARLVGGGGRPP